MSDHTNMQITSDVPGGEAAIDSMLRAWKAGDKSGARAIMQRHGRPVQTTAIDTSTRSVQAPIHTRTEDDPIERPPVVRWETPARPEPVADPIGSSFDDFMANRGNAPETGCTFARLLAEHETEAPARAQRETQIEAQRRDEEARRQRQDAADAANRTGNPVDVLFAEFMNGGAR